MYTVYSFYSREATLRHVFFLLTLSHGAEGAKHVYGVQKKTSREATILQARSACYARLAAKLLVLY